MRFLFCLLAWCSLSACKSSSLTPINTGSDSKWTGVNTYEVLVAVQAYTPETRLLFERDLAIALEKEGIRAVPSYTVYPNIALLNADTFSKFLAADPRLAVLFIQAKNVSRQQTNTNKKESTLFSNLMRGGDWDTTFVALLESGLYVQGQTDAVWWNRVKLEAKDQDVADVVQRYARELIKAMKQGGAISRLR